MILMLRPSLIVNRDDNYIEKKIVILQQYTIRSYSIIRLTYRIGETIPKTLTLIYVKITTLSNFHVLAVARHSLKLLIKKI